MKTPFLIWIAAIVYEVLILCFLLQGVAGLFASPALLILICLGALPGLVIFTVFMLLLLHLRAYRWIKVILVLFSTFFSATATLYLFFLFLGQHNWIDRELLILANGSALLGLLTFAKPVYKNYICNEA